MVLTMQDNESSQVTAPPLMMAPVQLVSVVQLVVPPLISINCDNVSVNQIRVNDKRLAERIKGS